MQANFLLFPDLTQLDLTGPYEVLARVPGCRIDLVSATMDPVRSDRGLALLPTATFESAAPCDLLVVPGGPGTDEVINDARWVDFTAHQAAAARYVLGICTGSLLLGAAGLLRGRRASSHWQAREFLPLFGAVRDDARICVDGHLFTSGGVTSGIDMALQAVALVFGADTARQIQLQIEYDPQPPFTCGTPQTAAPHIVQRCQEAARPRQALRAEACARAVRALQQAALSDGPHSHRGRAPTR